MPRRKNVYLASSAQGMNLSCALCQRIFIVCRPCFRGQKYCRQSCAGEARRRKFRRAGRAYSSSEHGKKMARERQARRRALLQSKNPAQDVTHHGDRLQGLGRHSLAKPIAARRMRPLHRSRLRSCTSCRRQVHWLPAVPDYPSKRALAALRRVRCFGEYSAAAGPKRLNRARPRPAREASPVVRQ